MLLLVTDEEFGLSVVGPHFVDKLLADKFSSIVPVSHMSPESDGFPINNCLRMSAACLCKALILVAEAIWHYLKVRLLGFRIVKEAGLSGAGGSTPPLGFELFGVAVCDLKFRWFTSLHDGQ